MNVLRSQVVHSGVSAQAGVAGRVFGRQPGRLSSRTVGFNSQSRAFDLPTCHCGMPSEIVETNEWDSTQYNKHAGFVPQLGSVVLDLLEPKAGERILDLGCGDGILTVQLQDVGCDVVGVDSSQNMVDAAQSKGLVAFRMDGQNLSFDSEFDAVVSNAALHWMKQDPAGVVKGVRKALRPGGRFVSESGGFGNVAAIVTALHSVLDKSGVNADAINPWFFPAPEQYREMLENEGFVVDSIHLIPRPTPLATDMKGWLQTFADSFLEALPVEQREQALMDTVEALRPALQRWDGSWVADYVRLRFKAHLPL